MIKISYENCMFFEEFEGITESITCEKVVEIIGNIQRSNISLRSANTKYKKNRQNVRDSERAAWRYANNIYDEKQALTKELAAINQRRKTVVSVTTSADKKIKLNSIWGTTEEMKQLVRELFDILGGKKS